MMKGKCSEAIEGVGVVPGIAVLDGGVVEWVRGCGGVGGVGGVWYV